MSALVAARRRKLQKTGSSAGKLNLVSLMDIFTILVFFLMINSSDVEVLQTSADLKLPDSTSKQRPDQQTTITVTDEAIVVMGRKVADVAALVGSGDVALKGYLKNCATRHSARVLHRKTVERSPLWAIRKFRIGC